MDNKAILEKAIQKAIDGGWDFFGHAKYDERQWYPLNSREGVGTEYIGGNNWRIELVIPPRGSLRTRSYAYDLKEIIFNHDFAKALWGEEKVDIDYQDDSYCPQEPAWIWNLMQMVIAEDPIKYLGENI